MSEKYTGLQARIKEKCAGHSLNLEGVDAKGGLSEVTKCFETVQKVFNFFSGSTQRLNILT